VEVGPFCVVGPDVVLEDGVRLLSHVVVEGPARIGARTVVHPFAALGGAPQHSRHRGEPTALAVGADCVIREHASIHRGTAHSGGLTVVGDRAFVMAGTHIGHDCRLGNDVTVAGAALGGHVEVGDFAIIGGQAGIHQFVRVGERAMIGGLAAVTEDVIPFGLAFGNHARLTGLNVVGLKRAGLGRDRIHALRRAVRALWVDGRPFRDSLAALESAPDPTPEVARVLDFIRAGSGRPLMGMR
jgi:UDP-N-acetylglucosamine acyltransferase